MGSGEIRQFFNSLVINQENGCPQFDAGFGENYFKIPNQHVDFSLVERNSWIWKFG